LSRLADFFPLEGVEHLERALAQKKGVLLLGCHLNSLCMFSVIIVLRRLGYDVRVEYHSQFIFPKDLSVLIIFLSSCMCSSQISLVCLISSGNEFRIDRVSGASKR